MKELSEILKELGINQSELAHLLSVDVRTVRRWTARPDTITGPAKQALIAFSKINSIGMPWRPDSIDVALMNVSKEQYYSDIKNIVKRVRA